jgi:hypothetical protein
MTYTRQFARRPLGEDAADPVDRGPTSESHLHSDGHLPEILPAAGSPLGSPLPSSEYIALRKSSLQSSSVLFTNPDQLTEPSHGPLHGYSNCVLTSLACIGAQSPGIDWYICQMRN